MTAAAIAGGCKFPPRFLYRILRRLVDAGLLTGVSGPGGGYALARQPRLINLLNIVTAVDGPLESSNLTPVCPKHRRAIGMINTASASMLKRSSQELGKITLEKLGRQTVAGKKKSTRTRTSAKARTSVKKQAKPLTPPPVKREQRRKRPGAQTQATGTKTGVA
jgi:Rrf2 family protein